jgi:penicillin amidase
MRSPARSRLLAFAVAASAFVPPVAALRAQRAAAPPATTAPSERRSLRVAGLRAPVALHRDSAGIVHIRAANEHDLFFAQGWSVARDRLFQLEHWRRMATGTLAEAIGPRGVPVDESTRLLRFRGDLARDLAWYHPRGATIVQAFFDGINAYVDAANRDTTLLPPEFAMLGIRPGRWTPAVVVSRHNGLFGNVESEVRTACEVREHGDSALRARRAYGPGDPRLRGDDAVDYAAFPARLLARYRADQRFRYRPEDLVAAYRRDDPPRVVAASEAPCERATRVGEARAGTNDDASDAPAPLPGELAALDGSNNWVVHGSRSASGHPLVANDPHRAITTPSLRYLVHLEAPGWNVIGGGEPALPGVAIGRNPHGAWGLTIFSMDMEDLVVLRLAPGDPDAYVDADGRVRAMRRERDTIRVRDAAPVVVTHRFSAHGPVLHVDTARGLAYALRAAWHERGTAPYLASLRLDQARDWRAFRAALAYARTPALNWVYADTAGTIGWQAAGIAPVRRGFSGLVPVSPRMRWDGYLAPARLPGSTNPRGGHASTANELNVPAGYAHLDAITPGGWAEPWRARRIAQVLDSLPRATLDDMARLQHDATSLASRHVRPLLDECRGAIDDASPAGSVAAALRAWNGVVDTASRAALLYRGFENALRAGAGEPAPSIERLPALVRAERTRGGTCRIVQDALVAALRFAGGTGPGATPSGGSSAPTRRYGDWHRTSADHPFAAAAHDTILRRLQPPPFPRGGDGNTPFATGNDALQRHGASLRVLFDLVHPDSARVTNTPGQSGDPRSPFFANLHRPWVRGEYAPLPMTRAAVDRVTHSVTVLEPVRASGRR